VDNLEISFAKLVLTFKLSLLQRLGGMGKLFGTMQHATVLNKVLFPSETS
jgi:hypothetical protein